MYLSFKTYQEILTQNAEPKPELTYGTIFEYIDFCIKHNFDWYGMHTGLDVGALYFRLKQLID